MHKSLLFAACSISLLFGCTTQKEQQEEGPVLSSVTAVISGETPYLFTDNNDKTYLSWTKSTDSTSSLYFASLTDDMKWSASQAITTGNDWFINWADYPMIATQEGENFIAHYLAKSSAGTYSYDINIIRSVDQGKTWSKPALLNDDGEPAEHGFVSMVPYKKNFFVSWLDGRNTVSKQNNKGEHGAMTLRAAVISPSGEKVKEWELDNRVCDCCQTSAAITDNGPVVVYRDRSSEEIRDISIVRLVDGNWTKPMTINPDHWKIAGCPVNGPRISAIGNHVRVIWFTISEGKASVYAKFSSDGGASFGPPTQLNTNSALGRVDITMIDKNTAVACWMEGANILAAKINNRGKILERYTIATSSESRNSGFPQLTKTGDYVIFAWTDTEQQRIKSRSLKIF